MHPFAAALWASIAYAGSVSVLSPLELAKHRTEYQIVDAREESAFTSGHVPDSRSLPWKAFTAERPGLWNWLFGNPAKWGLVDTGDTVQARLRALGLSGQLPFAVLGNPAEPGAEGRAAWNLLYWGAGRVSLVDGGFPAWEKLPGSKADTGAAGPTASGDFTVQLQPDRRAVLADVNQAMRRGGSLLDARTEAEFAGAKAKGQKRGGHLPGAKLIPIASLYEKDGGFLSAEALRSLVGAVERPITYCTGGVRSALLAVLLEARLGIQASNYDASLWEYSASPDLPLVQ